MLRRTRRPARADEPYRRALILIYSRLSATAKQLGHAIVHQPPLGKHAQPYATPQEFIADLDMLIDSLFKHGAVLSGARATGQPAPRC